jgi:hypothetical protein
LKLPNDIVLGSDFCLELYNSLVIKILEDISFEGIFIQPLDNLNPGQYHLVVSRNDQTVLSKSFIVK